MAKFTAVHDVTYVFTIKRTASGQFSNLWSLDVKRNDDVAEVISDNDLLSNCIAKIGYIFESDGL